ATSHPSPAPPVRFPDGSEPVASDSPDGPMIVAPIAGVPRTFVVAGPCDDDARALDAHSELLTHVVGRHLTASVEVEQAAMELAERYEEINLLYTISEILGRAVTLDETASTILNEVSETVGASRGPILLFDRVTRTLQPVA